MNGAGRTYLRFVLPSKINHMGAREGFFCAAYELRADDTLDDATYERLEDLLAWFRSNLAIPSRFNRTSSKGAKRRVTAGLSWYKATATEHLAKLRELIALLAEHGYAVETLRSKRIGYIVYEDAVQVVAEPFADTPR